MLHLPLSSASINESSLSDEVKSLIMDQAIEKVAHSMIFHSRDYQGVLKHANLETAVPNIYGVRVKSSQYIPRGLVAVVDRDGQLIRVINLRGTNEESNTLTQAQVNKHSVSGG